jgi:hypothetical protein
VSEGWTDYDEGYVDADRWSRALASGTALPVEAATVSLEQGEVAHAQLSPVTFAAYFAAGTRYQPSFFVFGGPVGLAVTASVAYGRDAAWRAQAQRDGAPQWHRLGTAGIVVTSRRLVLTGAKQTGAIELSGLGAPQLVAGTQGGPAALIQPPGEPPLMLESPWSPLIYVFVHQLVTGRAPSVPIPPAVFERAKAEGRLS